MEYVWKIFLQPLKVTITNFTGEETVDAVNHPADESLGSRPVVFTNTIYVDREDFREDAGPEFYRLKPGGEVKLRWSYVIKCVEVVKKGDEVVELKCTYDPATLVDMPKDRKVKGVIQWVSEKHGLPCTVRLLNKLLNKRRKLSRNSSEVSSDGQADHASSVSSGREGPASDNEYQADESQAEEE